MYEYDDFSVQIDIDISITQPHYMSKGESHFLRDLLGFQGNRNPI